MKKFKDIDVVDAIDAMVQHLRDSRVSLLVGAGASCCACSLYESWFGLIKDMVAYLYADELKAKGVNVVEDKRYYCHYNFEKVKKTSKVNIDDVIRSIIEREGVLQIPSQFEKRTGLRESIETYIESHTPQLVNDEAILFDKTEKLGSSADFILSMLRVSWNAIFTTNYDNMLFHIAEANGLTHLKECNQASGLSLRNMRELIVKLHGSIDFNHESSGFDRDKHRKYVITQGDYDDYPTEHEAFMQLMRISLLKDCLCIVGFSGKDANFIAWINWVREIIETDNQINDKDYPQAKDIKVFFIDARGDNHDEATRQYFENHRIYRILLTDPNVIKAIKAETHNEKDPERSSKLLKAFFEYLTEATAEKPKPSTPEDNDEENVLEKSSEKKGLLTKSEDSKQREEKDKGDDVEDNEKKTESGIPQDTFGLWAKSYQLTGKHMLEAQINEDAAKRLIRYRPYLRLARGTHYQSNFIDAIIRKTELTEIEAQMSLMALEQMQEDYEGEELELIERIEKVLKSEDEQERIKRLRNRHVTLTDPNMPVEGSTDMAIYERCARLAFTFNFSELNKELTEWQPSESFISKKLVLLSLVNTQAIEGILSQTLLDKIQPSIERFRATQLANILSGSFNNVYSVGEFTELSQHSIFSLRDWYYGSLIQPKERIHSYGIEDDETEEVKIENAVRCLNFMLETPIMPHVGAWSIVSDVQWYKVAHALFEKYPYPVLFYSTTINDTNTLKRIGQDYAYSKELHDQLPELTVRLFRLITDSEQPKSYWTYHSVCLLLCEMIKAVPSSYWDAFILKLWKEDYLPYFDESHKLDAIYKLICAGFSCSRNEELAITVINDCLKAVRENGKYHIAQNLLYYLRTMHSRKVTTAIKPMLSEFVKTINSDKDFILLGNLHRVVNKSFYKDIAKKIPALIKDTGINSSSINGLIYFAKDDKKALAVVKSALLESPRLWGNGVNAEGSFSPSNFIEICVLEESLKWTKEEVHQVYEKLVASAEQLSKGVSGGMFERMFNYESLYCEMMQFIDLHRQELSDVDGLETMYQSLEDKYKLLTDYDDLDKSIYTEVDSEMEACLEALAAKVKKEGIYHHIAHINVLVTRLLCRNKNSYNRVLNHMQYYVRYHMKTKEDLNLIPQLSLLVNSLSIDEFRNLKQNVILCSELTILMVEKLHELGMSSPGIDYWMKLKNDRYFNWTLCEDIDD